MPIKIDYTTKDDSN